MRLLLLTLTFALVGAGTAQACSCAPPGDPSDEIARADAAMFGKVIKRTFENRDDPVKGNVTYRFRVLRDYKDNLGEKLNITTSTQSATCGITLGKGDRIGLLLYRFRGELTSSSCSVRGRGHLDRGATRATRSGGGQGDCTA